MSFGQLVIGPPGSGKTTYCHGMHQYLTAIGRKVAIINLDPANDLLPYEPTVDVADLVHLDSVMEEMRLGPNGGLVYCMEYLLKNLDWLHEKLEPLFKDGVYLLLDCPGQVELFMMHDSLKAVVDTIIHKWNCRLTVVHLVDAHLCTEPSKYISALLLSLSTMLHLELPHVNVLSKIDLIHQYGQLDMRLEYYTEAQQLKALVGAMGTNPWTERHRKLSEGLCEVVEDFGLLSFIPLSIQEKESVQALLSVVDKANGCVFASLAGRDPYPELTYGGSVTSSEMDIWDRLYEKYEKGGKLKPIEERDLGDSTE